MVKARSIATFLLTNLGSRSDAARRQILSNCHYIDRGALTREGVSNFAWSALTQVLTVEKICWPDGCSCDTQLSSPRWRTWVKLRSEKATSPRQGEFHWRGNLAGYFRSVNLKIIQIKKSVREVISCANSFKS